jgi:core-2/I-Branching enzyme
VVLSGSCYPLVSVSELQDELASWRGRSRLQIDPLPYAPWSRASMIRDGGRHRLDRRFLTHGGRVILVGGYPIPTGRRAIPDGLRLHASSQWKIYARAHAETLLRVLDERPELVRFWSSAFVPQESCSASILASPGLAGAVAEQLSPVLPWYIDWRGSKGGHPRWLALEDFPILLAARSRPPLGPDDPPSSSELSRKLFARKMGPGTAQLLDRIDEQLRV